MNSLGLMLMAAAFISSLIANNAAYEEIAPENPKDRQYKDSILSSPAYPPIPSVVQKRASAPEPQSIKTIIEGQLYCYQPIFSGGDGYVGLAGCDYEASYDVFYRISFNVNKVHLCITAPSGVTQGGISWDYLRLRPCVINDPNQQWMVSDMSFHSLDKRFRIKHFKDFLYISKNPKDYYDHSLSSEMTNWLKLVARPHNFGVQTTVAWDLWTLEKIYRYYLRDDASVEDAYPLYYNASTSHIASYDVSTGKKICLQSNSRIVDNWNWASWVNCNDEDATQETSWESMFMDKDGGALIDSNGHFLRVTRYGSQWGVPYTVSPTYMQTETQYSPTSLFVLDRDFIRWQDLVNGNYGNNLVFCPAPGISALKVQSHLPPNFNLTEEWMRRLYLIASSSGAGEFLVGVCGTCLLHSLQVIAELQHNYPRGPSPLGYFFDAGMGVNPFISFYWRYPYLYTALHNIAMYHILTLNPAEDVHTRSARALRITISTMLPQYRWTHSVTALERIDMEALLRQMLNARRGSIFIAAISQRRPDGRIVGHVAPVISMGGGAIVVPVNLIGGITYERFVNLLSVQRSPWEIMQQLQTYPDVESLTIFELGFNVDTPLNVGISDNNCTGDGDDRRGNRKYMLEFDVNTCTTSTGRCALPR